MIGTDQLAVPIAVPESPVAALLHSTLVTSTLSEAAPDRLIEFILLKYGSIAGNVIMQLGGVRSYNTVKVSDALLPFASKAFTVMTLIPGNR